MTHNSTKNIYFLSARDYKKNAAGHYQETDTIKISHTVPFLALWQFKDTGEVDYTKEPIPVFVKGETYDKNECVKRIFGKGAVLPPTVIIYVHGFNNSMDDALQNAKEMRQGLAKTQPTAVTTGTKKQKTEKKELPILIFDWPSISTDDYLSAVPFFNGLLTKYYSAVGYSRDGDIAVTSTRILKWLVFGCISSHIKTHIFGHSMGTRIVVGVLHSIAHDLRQMDGILRKVHDKLQCASKSILDEHYMDRIKHFGQIMLKEGDVDVINTVQFITKDIKTFRWFNNPSKVFVFNRKDDEALILSSKIHKSEDTVTYRVGQTQGAQLVKKLCTEAGVGDYVDLIDASKYKTDDRSHHSYYKSEDLWKKVNNIIA